MATKPDARLMKLSRAACWSLNLKSTTCRAESGLPAAFPPVIHPDAVIRRLSRGQLAQPIAHREQQLMMSFGALAFIVEESHARRHLRKHRRRQQATAPQHQLMPLPAEANPVKEDGAAIGQSIQNPAEMRRLQKPAEIHPLKPDQARTRLSELHRRIIRQLSLHRPEL